MLQWMIISDRLVTDRLSLSFCHAFLYHSAI